ncbi:Protein of unknown function [Tessaracoccus bendigoensis DSM 12906]|uniref:DUF4240 domain-containing protein n=1 Tax=Tessaracoccus bendigoensis DSM 12906 TaxID=1123357 RepID=A0A1M6K0X8_9ACTN|nr:Protein of unknown function [Tessaracoccus bendigoensis DSM 12906]
MYDGVSTLSATAAIWQLPRLRPASWQDVEVLNEGFWDLVDAASAGEVVDDKLALLTDQVKRLEYEELLGFQRCLGEAHAELDNAGLYGAATALMGLVSDDVFESVRSWVILHGRAAATRVLEDPDSLADLGLTDEDEIGASESLVFVADQVHEERFGVPLTGRHPDLDFLVNHEPSAGGLPSARVLKQLYPRCSAVKRWRLPGWPFRR